MTPIAVGRGGVRHQPMTVPVVASPNNPYSVRFNYRAACSCGWRREEVNGQRANAIRAARKHAAEAQSE